jgi:uncharacterized protein YcbK (DUF882 family)
MPPKFNYFTQDEVEGLDVEYVAKLDMARAKTVDLDPAGKGVPFIITSGLRTPEKNQSTIGALPDSSHLKGLATDLLVHNSHETWTLVAALISVGINRIGIYVNSDFQPTHIHCDSDPDKVQEVIFIKQEASSNVQTA